MIIPAVSDFMSWQISEKNFNNIFGWDTENFEKF